MCEASFNLGMLHMQGDGVPRDLLVARECFQRGAAQNEKNDACSVMLEEVRQMIEKETQGEQETEDETEEERRGPA
jgi:TPR repeat protein